MKRFLALCVLVFIGVATWQIGTKLSADAIGMGVGVLFGALASIPTGLLLLASNRRSDAARVPQAYEPQPQYRQMPPVVVLTTGQPQPALSYDPYSGEQGYAVAMPNGYRDAVPVERQIGVRPDDAPAPYEEW